MTGCFKEREKKCGKISGLTIKEELNEGRIKDIKRRGRRINRHRGKHKVMGKRTK